MKPIKSPNTSFRRLTSVAVASILLATSFAFTSQRLVLASSSELSATERDFAKGIKSETIRDVVTALSADDMEGRGTAQPGGDKAANYIAQRFARLNLKPMGEKNSFLQPIKFRDSEFLPETSFKLGDQSLKMGGPNSSSNRLSVVTRTSVVRWSSSRMVWFPTSRNETMFGESREVRRTEMIMLALRASIVLAEMCTPT